jgi:hypothetical protein
MQRSCQRVRVQLLQTAPCGRPGWSVNPASITAKTCCCPAGARAVAAYNPYILCAASIFFCLLLVPFGLGQFRLVVVLGLLTFASVVLCQYAGCCGAVGSVSYLVGRILATGG